MTRKIIIIGGGIIGAMLANELRGRAEVTVLDAGGATASDASFGWINASFHHDDQHFRFRERGMARWRALDLSVTWGGALWWEEQGEELHRFRDNLTRLGYRAEIATAEQLSSLSSPPKEALFFPGEGFVDAGAMAATLLARSGARVLRGVPADHVITKGNKVIGVKVAGGVMAADQVVIAAGNGASALVETVGVRLPMLSRPGITFRTTPLNQPRIGDTVMVAPEMEFRMDGAGRLVAPTSPAHQCDTTVALPDTPLALANDALAQLSALVGQDLSLESVSVANRPVPEDGLPVIGPTGPEGLFVSVMHSGVTLAPVAAELLALEMDGQDQSDRLSPYRPSRFQT